jgi:hypothetical protein
MLVISKQPRQFLGIKTSTIWIRPDNSVVSEVWVVSVVLAVALVVLVVFVASAALVALIALTVLTAFAALIVFVALVAAVVAVVVVNSYSFLKKTCVALNEKSPCVSCCRDFSRCLGNYKSNKLWITLPNYVLTSSSSA